MSFPKLQLIYNTNKNNNNKTIKNAINKTQKQQQLKLQSQLQSQTNKNKNKNKKNNFTKRQIIKEKPKIKLSSTDENYNYVIMITSNKNNLPDSNIINWLTIVDDKSKEIEKNTIIPYKLQKEEGIYTLKIHLYKLDKLNTKIFDEIKEIIKANTKKKIIGKNKINRTEVYKSIIPKLLSLSQNLDTNPEFKIKVNSSGMSTGLKAAGLLINILKVLPPLR